MLQGECQDLGAKLGAGRRGVAKVAGAIEAPESFIGITAAFLIGYLLGSIPFGVVLTRLTGGPDLRSIGSGNIGATNVLRTGKKGVAAATLLGDLLKGTVAVLAGAQLGVSAALVAACGAFLGHLFPVWLGFRGGKGVATFLGCLLGFFWPAALVFAVIWLAMAFIARYSSLAALTASLAAVATLLAFQPILVALVFALLAALLWVKHAQNIKLLLAGEESRIGSRT
ncbi:MAG: glycerol-3-phosphate 1-O-acyltransferase PlsY [Hyphomicrobiales bacterium]|nr:glycerol-3-phosphate 1-O-acyltransferase PlsY [Hyphomicrobiales bacterium]MBV9975537.1 glycerol-3-phosphate 1-O-acyltransferase PlsY [Hyphomicrobiales bacterium]